MSGLVQLRARDTEKHRQCRCNEMRPTESTNARSEQLLVIPTKPPTENAMAAGRALEWVRMFEAQVGFFDMKYQACIPSHGIVCTVYFSTGRTMVSYKMWTPPTKNRMEQAAD